MRNNTNPSNIPGGEKDRRPWPAAVSVRRMWLLVLIAASVYGAEPAMAFDMPADSLLEVGGRLDFRIDSARQSDSFPWNYSSDPPGDFSRLMLDFFAGGDRFGEIYIKTAARWDIPRHGSTRTKILFEQGDYLWAHATAAVRGELRLFANERRYFTGELSSALLRDDLVCDTGDHYGLRYDGDAGNYRWTALGAMFGNGWENADKYYYVRAGWFGKLVQLSAAYLNETPAGTGGESAGDTFRRHEIVKGELSAAYRRFAAVVSYELSGVDDRVFLPPAGGGEDSDCFCESSPGTIVPDAGALFAEARLANVPVSSAGLLSLVVRYSERGEEYRGGPGSSRYDERRGTVGAYFSAREHSIDGLLEYTRTDLGARRLPDAGAAGNESYGWREWCEGTDPGEEDSEVLAGGLRGLLNNGSELFLRGGYVVTGADTTGRNFVNSVFRRHGRKIQSGLHVMLMDDMAPGGGLLGRVGVEAKLNVTTNVALYGRVLVEDDVVPDDSVYLRIEMRPADHVFATFGYGRWYVGDEPFMLEDPDIGRTGPADTDAVYFVTVRGDF